MAWSNSKIFRQFIADKLAGTTLMRLDGTDTLKAALFGSTGTPDQNVTAALSAYNAASSQWVAANEVSQAGQWAAGGVAITSPTVTNPASATVMFDANDTSSGTAATLAAFFGALVYDSTISTPVASQGISFNYFGGSQSVTSGQATVVWNANGIARITL